jgi:hypothetical protein
MTTQDLDDQEFGVRCQLHGGPCDGERVAWQAREFAPDRGFSPANIRRRSEIPGVKYVYERTHRDEEGIHHYDLTGRQGWSDCQDYDDVLVVYFGGPLHGQQEWIPLTTSGLPPEPIKIVEGVEYAYNELRGPRKYVYDGSYNPEPAKKNGVYNCQGYVRCQGSCKIGDLEAWLVSWSPNGWSLCWSRDFAWRVREGVLVAVLSGWAVRSRQGFGSVPGVS